MKLREYFRKENNNEFIQQFFFSSVSVFSLFGWTIPLRVSKTITFSVFNSVTSSFEKVATLQATI